MSLSFDLGRCPPSASRSSSLPPPLPRAPPAVCCADAFSSLARSDVHCEAPRRQHCTGPSTRHQR
eukprot:3940705-Rhodomonas_salina.1